MSNAPSRRVFGALAILILTLVVALPIRAQTKSFIWKATGPKGSLYLVGSVHMLTRDFYPLSAALTEAFNDSDLLVEELDLGDMLAPASQLAVLKAGMFPSGQSLERAVSPTTYALVAVHAAALGLPMEPLNRFKPWSLALTLLGMAWQKAGFDSELGLDRHFYDRAHAEGKAVQGLETVGFQIARLDEMSPADQDRMLQQALREIEQETPAATKLAEAWRAGDADTMARLVLADVKDDPEMYRRLIVERNQTWLPILVGLAARPRPPFVVVGAAHLVGPDGLLAGLRSRGFKLEQR